MAVRRYTRDQLHALRESSLVQKPENLPPIEQWLEYVYVDKDSREKLRIPHSEVPPTQNASNRRQPHAKSAVGNDASPMGSFGAGSRPGLIRTSTGSKTGEDISLGPPRTMFPSSRNAKLSDFGEKAVAKEGDVKEGDELETPRSRFIGDRANKRSVDEKDSRDTRDRWASVRERRAQVGDDESKHDTRFTRRNREDDGERRNGFAEKSDSRWPERPERRQNGEGRRGWRDREREKDAEKYGIVTEREPEWMDDPAPAAGEDDLRTMGMPKTLEQFQKWKDAMSGKRPQSEEIVEPVLTKESAPVKAMETLKLDGVVDKPFGSWGSEMKTAGTATEGSSGAKTVPSKGKSSRFASMFKESQPKEETPLAENAPLQQPIAGANGNAEDEAGFRRILQMLGGTGIGQPATQEVPSSPPARAISNGTKQKSRFTGFFDEAAKSPERNLPAREVSYPQNNGNAAQINRGLEDQLPSAFGERLPGGRTNDQPQRNLAANSIASPELVVAEKSQQAAPGRLNDIFLDQQPPSRGAATPDVNIQNLLAGQRAQKSQGQDKNSEFLLNLLQTKGQSRPTSQQTRNDNFSLWLDQPPNMPEPHAPQPRGVPPPPGYIDEALLRNAPQEPPRQDQSGTERRISQRAPPGFFDEQSLFLQQQHHPQPQQRRNFTEPPQHQQHQPGRRMSGHPQQPHPMQIAQAHQQQYPGGMPPDFLQSPLSSQGPQAPPPGFHPQMARHPPGFHHTPGMYQQQVPQQQQHRSEIPSGYAQGAMGGAGVGSPPNPPPGFYGGPGYMGMRGQSEGIPVRGGRGYEGGGFDGVGGMGGSRR